MPVLQVPQAELVVVMVVLMELFTGTLMVWLVEAEYEGLLASNVIVCIPGEVNETVGLATVEMVGVPPEKVQV